MIDRIGPDNITFETDYPHTDTTWPDTKKIATEMLQGVPDDDRLQAAAGQRHQDARPRPRLTQLRRYDQLGASNIVGHIAAPPATARRHRRRPTASR